MYPVGDDAFIEGILEQRQWLRGPGCCCLILTGRKRVQAPLARNAMAVMDRVMKGDLTGRLIGRIELQPEQPVLRASQHEQGILAGCIQQRYAELRLPIYLG